MTTITDSSCTWTAPAEAHSVKALRHVVEHWLQDQGVRAAARADWRLIVSELTANACEHAPPGAPVTVTATHDDGRIELQVRNPVAAPAGELAPHDPGPLSTRGRGLYIVDQLVDGVRIDPGSDSSVGVTCWRHVA